ncbi:MAG: KAP family P-loop NTPase fold protein [Cetobacterium sp.]|uniref:KAP family P-loop NTPase fold protein n=1 Tax=Cetobacterium sp. TaxID=2071632 RepID=UPI0025C270DB|nr:P-loop NTPase fold protein [Cetobacterium sp.]
MNIEEIYNGDLFERRRFIRTLMEYIQSYENECKVISIHSPWGTGKTTFIEMWKHYISIDQNLKDKYYTVYFNAWENDDSKNPLISILIELNEIPEFKNSSESKILTTAASVLSTKAPKFFLKALLGFFPLDSEIKTEINKFFSSLIEEGMTLDTLKEAFKNQSELEKYSEKFNDFNTEIIRKKIKKLFIQTLQQFQQKTNKKILFFIDELDRCRPTFAIETLETIKHLFSVENYNFILAWDLEQLSYSIGTVYGSNMDTGGYLRRFVDLECSLPKTDKEKYIRYLVGGNIHDLLGNLLKAFDFSLRDLEKIVNVIKITNRFDYFTSNIRYLRGNQTNYLFIIGYLLFLLKYKYPVLYIKLKNKTLTTDDKIEISQILEEKSRFALNLYNLFRNESLQLIPISKETFLDLTTELISKCPSKEFEISSGTKIDLANMVDSNGVNKLLDISLYF